MGDAYRESEKDDILSGRRRVKGPVTGDEAGRGSSGGRARSKKGQRSKQIACKGEQGTLVDGCTDDHVEVVPG